MRSLQVSTYSGLPDFNIPKIASQLSNLQKLQISAPDPQKIISGPKISYKTVSATDLRKEMTGKLPLKLREITISGKGFTTISETILQVLTKFHYYHISILFYYIIFSWKFEIYLMIYLLYFDCICKYICRVFNQNHFTYVYTIHRLRAYRKKFSIN